MCRCAKAGKIDSKEKNVIKVHLNVSKTIKTNNSKS
jgi:hypothetical protein